MLVKYSITSMQAKNFYSSITAMSNKISKVIALRIAACIEGIERVSTTYLRKIDKCRQCLLLRD